MFLVALGRELEEEDPSGILERLLTEARSHQRSQLVYRNLLLKNGERHTVFKLPISRADSDKLAFFWGSKELPGDEVYNFSMVPGGFLNVRNRQIRSNWTPKSKKILRALRKS